MPEVRCTVNNCHYWDKANLCGASEILIVNDQMADVDDDHMEIADIGYTPAAISAETCCKTFRPRAGRRA